MSTFVIRKDSRGAQVHVVRRDTGECIGCVESGLFEIVRAVIEEELTTSAKEGIPAETVRKAIVTP
jgi:hypothetical protein